MGKRKAKSSGQPSNLELQSSHMHNFLLVETTNRAVTSSDCADKERSALLEGKVMNSA